MLQDIRDNSQSTIAKIIVIAVIISLSIFGIDAIVGGFGGEPAVATVNGHDITEREFQQAVQVQKQRILSEMDRPDPTLLDEGAINQQVLESLIDRQLVYQDAHDRGLELTDGEIDQLITSMPVFQVDGQFSQERFLNLIRSRGMGVQEFRAALRRDYIARQVQTALVGGAFVGNATAQEILSLQRQSRDIATLTVDSSSVADQINVTEEEVQAYYADHGAQFMRPESVDVAWIELSREALASEIEVSEEDVRQLYEQRVATMAAQEERRVAHILLTPENGDEVAPERIATVQKALDSGRDFAEVAKEYSDDPGSARDGGDLGYARRDSFDPAFSEALFGISSEGQVVGPVETSYGVHFLKLLGVRSAEKPSFEELQDDLRKELKSQRADQLYIERSDHLADIAFSAFDLQEPASEMGVEVKQAKGISPEGDNPDPFDHQGLLRQLFSDDVLKAGNNSELVEVADGVAVVARVREHHPQQKLPLAEVKGEIRSILVENKTRAALDEKTSQWLTALKEGAEPSAIASKAGSEWTSSQDLERTSSELPAAVRQVAFKLPRPDGEPVYGKAEVPSGMTLIQLNGVTTPTVEAEDPAVASVRRLLAQRQGNEATRLYLRSLRKNAEIERQ